MAWADAFVAAFNRRDLGALAYLLAPDAVARVDGAPFPEERGREQVRETSLAYVVAEEQGLRARTASLAVTEGLPATPVLLIDDAGRLDMAIAVEQSGGLATSLVYYTVPHRPELVGEIARTLGLTVAEES